MSTTTQDYDGVCSVQIDCTVALWKAAISIVVWIITATFPKISSDMTITAQKNLKNGSAGRGLDDYSLSHDF